MINAALDSDRAEKARMTANWWLSELGEKFANYTADRDGYPDEDAWRVLAPEVRNALESLLGLAEPFSRLEAPPSGVMRVVFTVPCRFFVEVDVTDCETIEGAIYQWARLEAPSCLSVVGEPSEIVLEGDDSFPYEEFSEVAE